jgi:thiosulfate/3-mercaptopyruvate sulfurtransferase
LSGRAHIVDSAWLAEHLEDGDLVLADVRWNMSEPSGRERYDEGHIPGAHFVDLDTDLSRPAYDGPGRHPLPDAEHFTEVLSRIGLRNGGTLVAYDDRGGAIAARLWWMCRYFGVQARVAILDGGIGAWERAGWAVSAVDPDAVGAPAMALAARPWMVVDKAHVANALGEGAVVLDARGANRYRGEVEPVDARPGHIPGARSAPYVANLSAAGGALRGLPELRKLFEGHGALGEAEVIASCGSGVTACHDIWVLTMLGRTSVALYEGSWSDWSRDESLGAALGPEPGG